MNKSNPGAKLDFEVGVATAFPLGGGAWRDAGVVSIR